MMGKIFHTWIEWVIRGIPGGIGQRLRYAYYRRRFGRCGKNVRIEEWVIFQNPQNIEIGDNVWIFSHSILTAPSSQIDTLSENKQVFSVGGEEAYTGKLQIGNEVQVGAFNILNGIGGLCIENFVTLSARVSLYSATHISNDPDDKTTRVGVNGMVRSLPVFSKKKMITIGEGAWLGLGVTVICSSVAKDSFVQVGSLVIQDVPPNTVCTGTPTKVVRKRYSDTSSKLVQPS